MKKHWPGLVLVLFVLCVGFSFDKKPPLDPAMIIGKWKLDKSTTDGVTDTFRLEFREAYCIFTKDSIIEELMLWRGDTIRIPGTYSIDPNRWTMSTDVSDKSVDIDELTLTTLVLSYTSRFQNGPRVKNEQYYIKIE